LLAYVLFGVIKWLILGFIGQSSTPDEIFWEDEPNDVESRDERRAAFGRTIPLGAGAADAAALAAVREDRRPDGHAGEESPSSQSPQSARRRKRRRGHRGANRPPASNPSTPAALPPSDTSKGHTE
jgi:hypothetical protein